MQRNDRNRRFRGLTVAQYADDLRNGRWEVTLQGIAINTEGKLIDGQHRLSAVVKSGCTVPMMVTWDVNESTHLDSGLKRNTKDSLIMAGVMPNNSVFKENRIQSMIAFIVKRNSPFEYKLLTPEKRWNLYTFYQNDVDTIARSIFNSLKKKYDNSRNTNSAALAYAVLCAYRAGESIEEL